MAAKKKSKSPDPKDKSVSVVYNAGFGNESRPNMSQAAARRKTGFKGPAGSRIVQVTEKGQPKEWGGGTFVTMWAKKTKGAGATSLPSSKRTPKGVTSALPSKPAKKKQTGRK